MTEDKREEIHSAIRAGQKLPAAFAVDARDAHQKIIANVSAVVRWTGRPSATC